MMNEKARGIKVGSGIFLVLTVLVSVYFLGGYAYADGEVEIEASGTSGKPGEQLELNVVISVVSGSVSDLTVRIVDLPAELVLVQRSSEVSRILEGEERTVSIPIGTSTETPPGRYRVTYEVEYLDEHGNQKTSSGHAFVEVRVKKKDTSSEGCCGASAAAGPSDLWALDTIRRIRDNHLQGSAIGDFLVDFYYSRFSPLALSLYSHVPVTRTLARVSLLTVASLLERSG